MTMDAISPSGPEAAPGPPPRGWWLGLRHAENSVVVACLTAMVLLPLVEATLRRLCHTGVSSAATIVQHCGLILSMMGGAIAARDNRLLALSTLGTFLTGRARRWARLLSHAVGAAITAVLCLAAWRFMQEERMAGNLLAYGVRRWVVEAAMPLGFGLIALRLWWRAASGWKGRVFAGALAGLIVVLGAWPPLPAAHLVLPALLLLLGATMLGAPVFVGLGGAAVILYWGAAQPLTALPIEHYGLVVNATLPTIPLFTLAGYFLA
jgi:TRAP-type C4-dicarboxylate transport system permease small subunit